jgi:hypothetical protein
MAIVYYNKTNFVAPNVYLNMHKVMEISYCDKYEVYRGKNLVQQKQIVVAIEILLNAIFLWC